MPKIHILREDLINKIAAGEVIERPASVVKELIENSLDAKASRIIIDVRDNGKECIVVTDDGEGMEEEDAKACVIRHATSKIKDDLDLFNIQTLGFRGEALASIAAVSNLAMTTKTAAATEALLLKVDGGINLRCSQVAAPTGTCIEVRNLFFNMPVRKKFLRSDATELTQIVDVVSRIALINPQVGFRLSHNDIELLSSPSSAKWRNTVAAVYGIGIARDLLEVAYQQEGISISGFLAKPDQARNDKSLQNLYVNGRWIKNDEVNKIIYEGYHSLLFVGKHPLFVLNIQADPHTIDVNVHPTKQEVKFEQKQKVLKATYDAVRTTLEKHNLIPTLDFKAEQQVYLPRAELINKGVSGVPEPASVAPYSFEPSDQKLLLRETAQLFPQVLGQEPAREAIPSASKVPAPGFASASAKIPQLRLLGQFNKTFFVAETEAGVVFIDQHVVQERVLYERFMQQYMHQKVEVQHLLHPQIIECTVADDIFIKEHQAYMQKLGFLLEPFGERSFVLKTIPMIFDRLPQEGMLQSIIGELKQGNNKLEQMQEEIITRMACRASVKAGDELTNQEMYKLLGELASCNLPYTCPHGRAILIRFNYEELEKKFRRV